MSDARPAHDHTPSSAMPGGDAATKSRRLGVLAIGASGVGLCASVVLGTVALSSFFAPRAQTGPSDWAFTDPAFVGPLPPLASPAGLSANSAVAIAVSAILLLSATLREFLPVSLRAARVILQINTLLCGLISLATVGSIVAESFASDRGETNWISGVTTVVLGLSLVCAIFGLRRWKLATP